ncbi:nickel insertion protein [Mycolicibacterium hodleri]|uniref:DUF111 family protein n=1 Tax=Mycolicibacterium hodleri TaxID=49897 RepID=A0A502E7S3_9MYCO|nr:nickel insertion protein [Mycolicibacterium hodleri]TPG32490.1 DUF111 family protein [Mycolicibacterium hodleri]
MCAVVAHEGVPDVRAAIFSPTKMIGIGESTVAKRAIQRRFQHVTIDGEQIAVKLALLPGGRIVNAMPEFDDVARVGQNTNRPTKDVLTQAVDLAEQFITGSSPSRDA